MRKTLLDKNIKLVDLQQGIDTSLLSKISKYGVNVLISNPSTLFHLKVRFTDSIEVGSAKFRLVESLVPK